MMATHSYRMYGFHRVGGVTGRLCLVGGQRRVSDLRHSWNQGTRAGTNTFLNAVSGGDGRAGIRAPVPTHGACLERQTMQS